ncbi:MAG: radical SAM protein [Bacteroidales bacterium]|nr:radical SAM protein [Bacteroidales bacterium]
MNYYRILKINRIVKSERLKILGVGVLFLLKKRHLNVFLDPVMACNFRCLMCYFSDPEYKPDKSRIEKEKIDIVAENFFKYALKLQLGCGAEPSLYLHNEEIIRQAKLHNVPHISFTTNASLLDYNKIKSLVHAGLDEIIVSMHGTTKEVYEAMMPGAKIEKLYEVLEAVSKVKIEFPNFKLRINYTVNPDNIDNLAYIGDYLEKYKIDVLQIRPIRKIGNSAYSDFDLKRKQKIYSEVIEGIEQKCKEYSVVSLITKEIPNEILYRNTLDVAEYTYCYVSPVHYGNHSFDPSKSTYRKFLKKSGIFGKIIKHVFFTRNRKYRAEVNFGNYDVNI